MTSSTDLGSTEATFRTVAVHALAWLVAGNAVGLWLATVLLLPDLGDLLAPLTFGRLMPLHLNMQLYGWCALPMVGLLFRFYLPRRPGRLPRIAVRVWSACLVFGCAAWVSGRVSGKLFLDWTGAARIFLTLNFLFLAAVLWIALAARLREGETSRAGLGARAVVLAGLSAVPLVMWRATDPSTYQSINPASGGTTGTNVLGSALGTVVLFFVLPRVLGRRPRDGGRTERRVGAVLAAHFAAFAWIGPGDASHLDPVQVAAVASVAVWPPLLALHLRRFSWSVGSRRWLGAAGTWASLLFVSGLLAFLPGHFGGWKFTNALVGHAHLAMAGLLTSLFALTLRELHRGAGDPGGRGILADRVGTVAWHGGLALQIVALTALGAAEAARPDLLFGGPAVAVDVAYGLRWLGGLAMAFGSVRWLAEVLAVPGTVPHRSRRAAAVEPIPVPSVPEWAEAP